MPSNQVTERNKARTNYENAVRACRQSGGNPDTDATVQRLKSVLNAKQSIVDDATDDSGSWGVLS